MVLLIGGYPMLWNDAKAWALRHWPDIEIDNDNSLAYTIQRYHKDHGQSMTCVPVEIDKQSCLLIVVHSKYDRASTPRKHRRFPESERALQYKAKLFSHEEDKALAESSHFTTIADPFMEWSKG